MQNNQPTRSSWGYEVIMKEEMAEELSLHLLQCQRIYTVTQATGRWSIWEYVAQMGIANIAQRFHADHPKTGVRMVRNGGFVQWLGEGGPTRTALEFGGGIE